MTVVTWTICRHRVKPTGFWINGQRTTRLRFFVQLLSGAPFVHRWLAVQHWCRTLRGGL